MPKIVRQKLWLSDKDLADLRVSGLTDETIHENRLHTIEGEAHKLSRILNRDETSNACLGGLVFPYRDLNGTINCFARVKPHMPRKNKDGEPIKYEQPVGASSRAYYPETNRRILKDASVPL